ncbi:MAG: DUF1573 domain-containing protein [Bacteroidetes bacterium]|nr:MAG: DUF1573 domain-containing protein [Bacteroidota bacterium]TAG87156.1 MAG: DUF1573 domain-containing protein [Bacteroidota bacterium]
MKKICIWLFLSFVLPSVFAQGIMNFKDETHDFGNIDEGMLVSYEFEFTNTGDQPLEIIKVDASCGCTAPSWTTGSIYPNKKGIIKATFDSKDKPGPFTKSLTVKSNSKKQHLLLYIKGFVKAKASGIANTQGKNAENSAIKLNPPSFQLDRYSFDFGKVESGEKPKQRFTISNTGQENLVITSLESKCNCISFGLSNGVVAPGQSEVLELTINTDKIHLLDDVFTISSNDPFNPKREMKIKADIYENFGKQMFLERKSNAPFER